MERKRINPQKRFINASQNTDESGMAFRWFDILHQSFSHTYSLLGLVAVRMAKRFNRFVAVRDLKVDFHASFFGASFLSV
jgi:hypothetical protein